MADDGDRALVSVRDVEVVYGGAGTALRGVSLDVPRGGVVALLGPNGAGKTTLLRAVTGLLGPHRGAVTAGSVVLDGQVVTNAAPDLLVRRGVAQVLEGRRVFAELTVEENLRAGAFSVRDRAARNQAHQRVLDLFPLLAARRGQLAGYLSGGEQQMVAIGRALMQRPRLLILDEPSLGMAPRIVDQVAEIVRTLNAEGTSVLLVEQHTAMALAVADRAYVLDNGRVVAEGTAAALAHDGTVRAAYLGRTQGSGPAPGPPRTGSSAASPAGAIATHQAAAAHGDPPLEVSGLTLRFGGVTAVDDVSFSVAAGQLLAIIGPNGAGKTSILNCLSGLHRPQQGSIRVAGTEMVGRRPSAAAALGVARTFQNLGLFPGLDVLDNLMLGRHHLSSTGFLAGAIWVGKARAEEIAHRRRCEDILELLGLQAHRHAPVHALPYGVQKRVELGRALAMEPRLLLLDEPVAGMNGEESEAIGRAVLQLRDELELAIVLVEHDMSLVMDVADRVLVLDFGRMIAVGPPAAVQADAGVISAYLGQPRRRTVGSSGAPGEALLPTEPETWWRPAGSEP